MSPPPRSRAFAIIGERMRAHYLQHVPFELLGSIEPWLRAERYEITSTRFFESARLPDPNEVDLLIVMGGPMSVNDEELPWLLREKRFIRNCIQSGKSVLGICLGAQLIASAAGASVYRNRVKEIGWFPVQGLPSNNGSIFHFPQVFEAFHWHGETFDLPPGAVHIAKSEGCKNQAFQLGRSIIGLQFHLEMTPESIRQIVSHCRAELTLSKYVQSEMAIIEALPEKCQKLNDLMANVLCFLTRTDV
jgi:GMP synthase-like glutamine amidotransferase